MASTLLGRRRVADSHQQYARRLLVVRDQERAILAEEVHREVSQRIAALQMELSRWNGRTAPEVVAQAKLELERLGSSLRSLTHRLHPRVSEKMGLGVALEDLRDELDETLGFTLRLDLVGAPMPKDTHGHTLYRIVQEAVNNTRRHAGVTEASVRVEVLPDAVLVEVSDQGAGFDPTSDQGRGFQGLGIISIRERAAIIGATVAIQSQPGAGTRLRVRLPRTPVPDGTA